MQGTKKKQVPDQEQQDKDSGASNFDSTAEMKNVKLKSYTGSQDEPAAIHYHYNPSHVLCV